MKLFQAKAPKWYKPIGNGQLSPLWTLPKADGSGEKTPTLRDARKLGLLPSVTEILKVIHKPAIEKYRLNQVLQSALTLPRIEGEDMDSFALRVELDSDQHRQTSADLGTRIHAEIAYSLKGMPVSEDMKPYFREWGKFREGLVSMNTEMQVGSETLGYAGTLDLQCLDMDRNRAVFDFKSQDVKNDKPNFYGEWALQLSAYAQAMATPHKIVSVIISTNEQSIGRLYAYVWPREQSYYFDAFQQAFGLWRYLRDGFDPRVTDRMKDMEAKLSYTPDAISRID